jgi:hypothetical protein
MNKALDSGTLATKFKESIKSSRECTVEIRAPMGNTAGQRLQKALSLAGVTAELISVAATPKAGIMIEASQRCAQIALSIQTSFKAAGLDAHLLVQNARRPDLVIIHLNADDTEGAP